MIKIGKKDDDFKSESIAWELITVGKGKPMLDFNGDPMYKSVPVPAKEEGIIFCPHCDQFKEIETVDLGGTLKEKGCNDCGMTLKEFHMRRVNDLW